MVTKVMCEHIAERVAEITRGKPFIDFYIEVIMPRTATESDPMFYVQESMIDATGSPKVIVSIIE